MRQLDRTLSLTGVVAISVGAMLGGEIFVLPSVAAALTGPSLWIAYLLAALLVLPAALSKSELATALPTAGGSYVYIERGLGPLAGTVGGIGLWLSLMMKSAFALVVLGSYLHLLVEVRAKAVALGLLLVVVALNVIGVKRLGKVQTVVVAFCFAVLSGLVLVGIRRLPPGPHFAEGEFLTGGTGGLLAAVGLVFLSYAGVTKIAAVAEEVRDEARNIPLGMMISLGMMTVLYAGISWILVGHFASSELEGMATPVASLAHRVLGANGATLVEVTAVLALLSMANAGLLASSRFPLAMARDELLPSFLRSVSSRFGTPIPAVLVTGVSIAAVLELLDVVKIAKLGSAFMIAAFCVNNLAVIILRESATGWYRPRFRAPLYPALQIFGIVTGIALLVAMGRIALYGLGAGCLLGALTFGAWGRRRVSRLGVLRQILQRPDLAGAGPDEKSLPGGDTVVALSGRESSAEALVHLGATLAGGRELEVVLLQETSEQGEAFSLRREDEDRIASLGRRALALTEERGVPARFDILVTRDIRRSLFEAARRKGSRWLVMAWRNRRVRGFILRNPFEWALTHVPCNLALFKDAGIRTYRKILVLAEPGPHDALVVRTADELAALFRGKLTLARFLPSDASERDAAAVLDYHDQLTHLCQQVEGAEVLRGDDEVATLVAATARFDLLVLGAPPESPLRSMFLPSRQDRVTEHAHCAVLRLRTPREQTHEAVTRSLSRSDRLELIGYLSPETVQARLAVRSKELLFERISQQFAAATAGGDAGRFERAFWDRERLQNTAVGDGVAMPHATLDGLGSTRLGVFTLERPIPYGTVGGGHVDVFLCTVGPPTDRNIHLQLLSVLARLLLKGSLLPDLRAAGESAEIVTALERATERLRTSEAAAG